MLMVKKALIYVTGLLFMAFGVAFSVNSSLGVSPVNSLPYVISRITGLDLGNCVIGIFCFLYSGADIIVKKKIPSHRFDAADISHDFWPFCRCCKESGGRFCHSHLSGAAGYAGDQYRFCSNRRMPVYGCAAGKYAYGRNDPCSKPCILPGQAFS